jgi:hypothetical protein
VTRRTVEAAHRAPSAAPARRNDGARKDCSRMCGFVTDPAVWAWAVVALLALLPLREVLAGF